MTRDIDFRPAPPGWRIWFIDPDTGEPYWQALPGWLIRQPPAEGFDEPPGVEVIAAVAADGFYLDALEDAGNAWTVQGPGEPDPSAAEIEAARSRLRRATA